MITQLFDNYVFDILHICVSIS